MAPPHLLLDRVREILGAEATGLFCQDDLEGDVQQQVAEFGPNRVRIVGDRVVQLESLFDEIRPQALGGLGGVPGTPFAQFPHEFDNASKR